MNYYHVFTNMVENGNARRFYLILWRLALGFWLKLNVRGADWRKIFFNMWVNIYHFQNIAIFHLDFPPDLQSALDPSIQQCNINILWFTAVASRTLFWLLHKNFQFIPHNICRKFLSVTKVRKKKIVPFIATVYSPISLKIYKI